jgi:hypothetical protein
LVEAPTLEDIEILRRSARLETGGFGTFTSHFFSPVTGNPRTEYVGTSPDTWQLDFERGDYVPWLPLPWQYLLAHDYRKDATIIGGFGSGKTVGVAAVGIYYCAMMNDFKFLDATPVAWQSFQMFREARTLVGYEQRERFPKKITKLISRVTEKPAAIYFTNGSMMEFLSADREAEHIRSWTGDLAVIDEAGLFVEPGDLVMNLGSRLRGQVGGRPRMGKLICMGNADDSPWLWDRFDLGLDEEMSKEYLSILLTIDDNPYITPEQKRNIEARIVDESKRKQYLYSERPIPRGKEFTEPLIDASIDHALDAEMQVGLERKEKDSGYIFTHSPKIGVTVWELPAKENHDYIVVGDPGQASPPNRNSGVVLAFDVTAFPSQPASLAAFAWIDGKGSYWPWIYRLEDYHKRYKPLFTGFDSTGVQKGFDELVFSQRGIPVTGMNMQSTKMQMVAALKLLMGRGMIRMPAQIRYIWHQLAAWHMPDTKLNQDIASALFMAGYQIHRLFWYFSHEVEESEIVEVKADRYQSNRSLRPERHLRRARTR